MSESNDNATRVFRANAHADLIKRETGEAAVENQPRTITVLGVNGTAAQVFENAVLGEPHCHDPQDQYMGIYTVASAEPN